MRRLGYYVLTRNRCWEDEHHPVVAPETAERLQGRVAEGASIVELE
jgi:hypothetical protein